MLALGGGNRWLSHLHINGLCAYPLSLSFTLHDCLQSKSLFNRHFRTPFPTFIPSIVIWFGLRALAQFAHLNPLILLPTLWKRHQSPCWTVWGIGQVRRGARGFGCCELFYETWFLQMLKSFIGGSFHFSQRHGLLQQNQWLINKLEGWKLMASSHFQMHTDTQTRPLM